MPGCAAVLLLPFGRDEHHGGRRQPPRHHDARAMADPRRFAMLRQIAVCGDGLMCSALEVHEEISPATVSHHLKELQEAGLLELQREGRLMRLQLRREVWERYLGQLRAL